jgi:transposase
MKHSLEISKADFELARYKKDTETHSKIRQRMHMLYLHYKGYSKTKIADILGVKYITIWRWSKIYKSKGIKELEQLNYKGQPSELDDYKEEIEQIIDASKPTTIKEIRHLIGTKTNIWRSLTQVTDFVKNHSEIKRRKVQPLPGGKRTIEELIDLQKEFLRNKLNPLIEKALSEDIRLFFCDAVHPTHGFHKGHVYSKKPHYVRTGHGRYRFNMYSAIDAKSKELYTIYGGKYVNAETVVEFFDLLREHHAKEPLYLIMDNARYQHCKYVIEEAKKRDIELVFLPPYSPNLNIIERLWKFMKKKVLSAKCYASKDVFEKAFLNFLDELEEGKYRDDLSSLLTLNFQTLPTF